MKNCIFILWTVLSTAIATEDYYLSNYGDQNATLFAYNFALPLDTEVLTIFSSIKTASYCECKNACLELEECAIASYYTSENYRSKCVLTKTPLDQISLLKYPNGRVVAKLSKAESYFGTDGQFYVIPQFQKTILEAQTYCGDLPAGNALMIKDEKTKSAALAFLKDFGQYGGYVVMDLIRRSSGYFRWGDGTIATAEQIHNLFSFNSTEIREGADIVVQWGELDEMNLLSESISAMVCQIDPLHQVNPPTYEEEQLELRV